MPPPCLSDATETGSVEKERERETSTMDAQERLSDQKEISAAKSKPEKHFALF